MKAEDAQVNDIVQIINPDNQWYGCLLQITEVKTWGIQGFALIPCRGRAFYRVDYADIKFVGMSYLTEEQISGKEEEVIEEAAKQD